MDIFTHVAAITVILPATGNAVLVPFGIIGAVVIDIDMAYSFMARKNPSRYILFHGGINHSIAAGTVLSLAAFGVLLALSSAGLLPIPLDGTTVIPALAAVVAGAYLHLVLDFLAAPGLPLLYPLTEKRFGQSLFPMPLYFSITLLSLVTLGIFFLGGITPELAGAYGMIFIGITAACWGIKWFVDKKVRGRSFSPFQWTFRRIGLREEGASWTVVVYDLIRGVVRETVFEKYRNITPSEARTYEDIPEVRRHRFFSYISIAEKNGSRITFHDPVREEGLIRYPPYFQSETVGADSDAP